MTQSPQPKPKKPKRKERLSDKEQSERFIEAARFADANDAKERFEQAITVLIPPHSKE